MQDMMATGMPITNRSVHDGFSGPAVLDFDQLRREHMARKAAAR